MGAVSAPFPDPPPPPRRLSPFEVIYLDTHMNRSKYPELEYSQSGMVEHSGFFVRLGGGHIDSTSGECMDPKWWGAVRRTEWWHINHSIILFPFTELNSMMHRFYRPVSTHTRAHTQNTNTDIHTLIHTVSHTVYLRWLLCHCHIRMKDDINESTPIFSWGGDAVSPVHLAYPAALKANCGKMSISQTVQKLCTEISGLPFNPWLDQG